MRDQAIGDTVRVRGVLYEITAKDRDITGDRGFRWTLSNLDETKWHAYGWRVMHNSRLIEATPAPVAPAPAPTPVECDHMIGAPGCTLVTCDGVPPLDAPADADPITIDADARPVETGPETLGRAIMINLVGRLSTGDHVATVSAPTWSSSGAYNHPAGTVRDFSRYALTADGYDIVIMYYESAGHSVGRLPYYAVSVDGFICDQGSAIKAAQTVDHVAGAIGYAVIRHLELITHPDSLSWEADYSPNAVPLGATLTPRRIDAVQGGDVIRSFSADGHATVTGPVKITPSGEALVPVERDGDARTLCQPRGRTVAIITLPDQAPAPAVEPAPAPVVDQAPAKPAPGAPVVAFTVSRDVLADALAYVAPVAYKPRTPVLGGVLITADASGVRVQTFDYDELRTVRLVGADITVPGRVLVPCEILTTVAREGLPAGTPAPVSISATDRELLLTWQRYRLTLPTLPVEDYPSLDAVAPAPAGTFDMRTLADALARVGVAAGKDDTVPVLKAVHVAPAGDALALTTCDRYRVATDRVAWSPVEGADTLPGANVPARTFIEFGKIAADAGGRVAYGVGISDFSVYASLTAGAYSLAVRLVEGEFPDLAEQVPATYAASATVDTRALVKAIGLVTKGHGGTKDPRKMARVALTFRAGEVTVSGPATDDGKRPTDTLPATFNGHDGFTLTVRAPHLVAGLKTAGRTALLAFTTKHGMTLTRPADGGDAPAYGYLMPACMTSKDETDTPAGAGVNLEGPTMTISKSKATTTRTRKASAPAPAPAVPVVEAETVERVAHAAYVAYKDAKDAHAAGDMDTARVRYAVALAEITQGETMSPGHLVAGKLPWSEIRKHVTADAATLPAPAPAVEPVPAAPAPVAVTPAPAKVPGRVAITHGPTGTLMVGTPYPLRFKVSALLNAKNGGLGWTFAKDAVPGGAWVLDGSAGQPADSGKIRAAVDALATLNVAATVAVDGYDADATPAAPVPSVEAAPVDPATVYDILSRVTWSIETVKPRGGKSHAASVLKLPAGRLSRDVYTAIKDVMTSLGGAWQRSVSGFSFTSSEPIWGTNPVRYTASGSEKLGAWLASNAPAGGDQATPAAPVEAAPAVEAPALKVREWMLQATDQAPAPATPVVDPMASLGLVVGQYTRIDGADGHGNPITVIGYVQHATDTDSKGVRVRVGARMDGTGRTVYVTESARVEHLDAPAPAVEAPAVPVLTVADMPAPVVPAPADAATLTVAAVAARAAMDAPAAPAPVVDQVAASGPLTFTLAAYSADAGVSYRESRKRAWRALDAAGIRAKVNKDDSNRRVFTVEAPDGVDRAALVAIVTGAVTLAADVPAPVA